jgi:hypothetical protein
MSAPTTPAVWLAALRRGLDPLAWWASLTGGGGFLQGESVRVAIELAPQRRARHGAAWPAWVRVTPLHRKRLDGSAAGCITARVPITRLHELVDLPRVTRVMPGFIGGQAGSDGSASPRLALRLLRASAAERAALVHRLRRAQAHGRSRRVVDRVKLTPAPKRRSMASEPAQRPVIGIIDFGCAFLHPALQRNDGRGPPTTRVLQLWDQGRDAGPTATRPTVWPWKRGAAYGRVADRAALDALADAAVLEAGKRGFALGSSDWRVHELCYAMAEMPELLQPGSHGTAVAALAAAGNDADILFVQLPQDAIDDLSGGWLTAYLVDALAWLEQEAQGRPLVVNLSVGTHAGPHDGGSLLECELTRRAQQHALVLAAGNAAGRRGHAQATLAPGATAELHWVLPTADPTQSFCEVWYDLDAGATPPRFSFEHDEVWRDNTVEQPMTLLRDGAGTLAAACVHLAPAGPGAGRFWVALAPTWPCQLEPGATGERASAPPGTWRLRVENRGKAPITLQAWLERDEPGTRPWADRPDSVFVAPAGSAWSVNDHCTLTAQASAKGVLAVGGTVLNAGEQLRESGQGPTRDGRDGVTRWAAADQRERGLDRGLPVQGNHSGPDAARPEQQLRWRGTSLAAPQVVAELIELLARQPQLTPPQAVSALAPMKPPPAARSADRA